MQHSIRVLLADDEVVVRDAIGALLESDDRFRVVASVGSGFEAAARAGELKPDVAVLDVRMPGGGPENLRAVRTQSPETVVIVCSSHDDPHTRRTLVDAGAAAYVVKGHDDVLDSLRQVLGMNAAS